jgi:uncharacterized transporter YbjL
MNGGSIMKKIITLILVLFVLALTGCAAQAAQLQQLPEEGVNLVFILVTAAVTWLLLTLKDFFKIDLSGYAGALAAALAPLLVAWFESYLQLIPAIFDNVVLTVIHLIVLLVGSLGTFWLFQRKAAPSLK